MEACVRAQRFLPLFLLSLLMPGVLRAQWGIYGNALTSATYNQFVNATVADGAGGAIVVWRDERSGTGADIYAQRVNGAGAVQWAPNGAAVCVSSIMQWDPQLVADGAGGVIITWSDQRNFPTTAVDIYAQRLNADGAPQWALNGIPVCMADGTQQAQQIVSDGAGGAIIVWADYRNVLGADIYAQRVDPNGTLLWANPDTLCGASQDQSSPLLVSDMAGGAISVWRDMRNGQHADIYAQRINSDGQVHWATNGVSLRGTVLDDSPKAAVSDGAGGAIVVSIDGNDIHAERVNAAGVAQWGSNGVALCTHWSGETDAIAVADGVGGVIAAWKDLRDPAGDIYAQRVNNAGTILWWPTGEWVAALPGIQSRATAISDGNQGVIVTWQDLRNPATYDIYAQRLNASGDYQWTQNGVALITKGSDQYNPVIAPDGFGGAIVSWDDIREQIGSTYYTDVYARRVSHGGTVVTAVSTSTPALPLELSDNYPNPFSATTTFDLRLQRDSRVNVEVFDAAGRRVRALDLGRLQAGPSRIAFDGLDERSRPLPSGVYFYRVRVGDDVVTRKMVIAR